MTARGLPLSFAFVPQREQAVLGFASIHTRRPVRAPKGDDDNRPIEGSSDSPLAAAPRGMEPHHAEALAVRGGRARTPASVVVRSQRRELAIGTMAS